MPASPVLAGLTRTVGGGLYGFNGVPSSFAEGVPATEFGQIAISGEAPTTYLGGLPLTADARISQEFAVPVLFNGKWPITAAGKLAVVSETVLPVVTFQNGFGYAATGQMVEIENVSDLPVILGPELIPSTIFTQWTDPTVPDDWVLSANDAVNFVEEATVTGGFHLVAANDALGPRITTVEAVLTAGKDYQISYRNSSLIAGVPTLLNGFNSVALPGFKGNIDATAVGTNIALTTAINAVADFIVEYLSVRELITGTIP